MGVQDRRQPDIRAQMLRIYPEVLERLRCEGQHQRVDLPLMAPGERAQFPRQGAKSRRFRRL